VVRDEVQPRIKRRYKERERVKTSAGTIPAGLELYIFEYPKQAIYLDSPWSVFLMSDDDAREFAREEGAIKIIHSLSGREIKP